jgi:hypothetical protein
VSQGLKPCPTCGNQYPEIESGDMVVCEECGETAFFDNWQQRRADAPPEIRVHKKGAISEEEENDNEPGE